MEKQYIIWRPLVFEINRFAIMIIGIIFQKQLNDIIHLKKITFIDFIGEIRRIWTPMFEFDAVVVIQH